MEISGQLISFRTLLKKTFSFLKANWRSFFYLLIPIEFVLFVYVVSVTYGVFEGDTFFAVAFAMVCAIGIFILSLFKKIVIFSGGLIVEDIVLIKKRDVFDEYRKIAKKSFSVAWVAILNCILILFFAIVSLFVSIVLFLLPFVLLGLAVRVYPQIASSIPWENQSITLTSFFVVFAAFLVSNLFFISHTWFASYVLLLEEKSGVDAIVSSFLYMKGRRWKIFFRFVGILLLTLIPLLVFLGPIYYQIIVNALRQIAIALLFGLPVVIPKVPLTLSLWRDVLTLIVNFLWAPFFMVMSFFLWKDVRATAIQFDEISYMKVRKWVKISLWIGVVFSIVTIIGAFIGGGVVYDKFGSQSMFDNISPTGLLQQEK